MSYRTASVLLSLLAIIFLPYWIYLPVFFAALVFFPFFWEGILLGLLIDMLYGEGIRSYPEIFTSFGFIALVIAAILIPLRKQLRFDV